MRAQALPERVETPAGLACLSPFTLLPGEPGLIQPAGLARPQSAGGKDGTLQQSSQGFNVSENCYNYSFPTFERQDVALELPQMSGVVRLHHGKRPGFKLITANELLRMPDDGFRYELVQGALRRMSSAGLRHGRLIMNIAASLDHHVRAQRLGMDVGAQVEVRSGRRLR